MAPEWSKGTAISSPDPWEFSRKHKPFPKSDCSEPHGIYDTPGLDEEQPSAKNIKDDECILLEYKWELYKGLPPAMQEAIEANLLIRLLPESGNMSYDACVAFLKNQADIRGLLLDGWEKGTFEALRSHLRDKDATMLLPSQEPVGGVSLRAFAPVGNNTITRLNETDRGILARTGGRASTFDIGAIGLGREVDGGREGEEDATGERRMDLVKDRDGEGTGEGGKRMDPEGDYPCEEGSLGWRDGVSSNPVENGIVSWALNAAKSLKIYGGKFVNTSGGDVYNVADSGENKVFISSLARSPTIPGNELRKVAEWYFSIDYRATHNEIAKKRSKSTGEWFLQTKTYGRWLTDPQPRILWCPGIPGVGKTVMASLVVDHLRTLDESETFVGILYFDYKLRSEQSKLSITEALCRQMFELREHPILKALYDLHAERKSRPAVAELRSALCHAFQTYPCCYLVLDALDEYAVHYSDKQVVEVITDLMSMGENVKLLVTSRILGEMKRTFRELGASNQEIIAQEHDMRVYLAERVESLRSKLDFEVSDEFSQHMVEKVIKVAKGRFLVAELGMNLLDEQLNLGELEDAVDTLPSEIDETYVRVIKLIKTYPEARRELAMKALMWVAYARRHLSVRELQHALAIKHGRKEISKYVTPLSTITGLCAGLIIAQDKEWDNQPDDRRTVQFVHFTTQEFFERSQFEFFNDAHQEMFSACAEYLSVTGNHSLPTDFTWASIQYSSGRRIHLPFYDYSALNWGHHASCHHKSISGEVKEFLLRNDRALGLSWEYTLNQLGYMDPDTAGSIEGSGMFLAAYHDQVSALPALLNRMDVIPRTKRQRTPLHVAAHSGRPHFMKEILHWLRSAPGNNYPTSGDVTPLTHECAEMNARDDKGWSPLHYAAICGHKPVVQLLLAQKATEVDPADNNGRTPLWYAATEGHLPVVKLLLSQEGVNVNIKDNDGWTPLSYAAAEGKELVIELLLQHAGIEVDKKDTNGRTPLSYAAQSGNESAVKLLLDHGGIEVDSKDNYGRTPFSYAAQSSDMTPRDSVISILNLLLHPRSVDMNSRSNRGRTPLSYAAGDSNKAAVTLLLKYDAVKVDGKDNNGRTPLSYAVEGGDASIAKLLLGHREVEVNSQDKHGRTPLSYAIQSQLDELGPTGSNINVVSILLEHEGIDVNLEDNIGMAPLWYAVEVGDESVVKLLLQHGDIEVDSKNYNGQTPLSYAAEHGNESIVKLLLDHGGAKVDSKDNNGRTPLSYAAEQGRDSIVELLLDHDNIEVDSKDNNGRTPFSYAVKEGKEAIIELLLERGDIEVDSQDNNGRTPLSYVVQQQQNVHPEAALTILNLLLQSESVNVNSRDNNGRTPLSYAVGVGERVETSPVPSSEGVDAALPVLYESRKSISGLLLEHEGTEVDSNDNDWRAPLSYTTEWDQELIVKALLERKGVEMNSKDNHGRTPLSYAVEQGKESIIKLLHTYGAIEA